MSYTKLTNASLPDNELIAMALNGGVSYYDVLMERHSTTLYKVARGYGFTHDYVEEILRKVHIEAFDKLRSFTGGKFELWLTELMINNFLQPYTDNSPSASLYELMNEPAGGPDFAFETEREVSHRKTSNTEKVIELLPLFLRKVFITHQVAGFSIPETAKLWNMSETKTATRIQRCRQILKKLTQNKDFSDVYDSRRNRRTGNTINFYNIKEGEFDMVLMPR